MEDRLRMILKGVRFPIKAKELSDKRGYLLVIVNSKTFTLAEIIRMISSKEFNSFDELLNAMRAGQFEK